MKFPLFCLLAPVVAFGPVMAQAPTGGPIEVNGIVAKVNGKVITKSEVGMLLASTYAKLVAEFPRRGEEFERQFKEARDNTIQDLIDREIILDEFKTLGAYIKPSLIDEEVERQIRENYKGDESKFREVLKENRLTMEGYRELTYDKMVVDAMRREQFKDAPPPLPNEIQAEYDKIKTTLRDTDKDVIAFQKIFIPRMDAQNPLATPETQLALSEDLVRQLKEGADFAELAKRYSRDAFSEQGGVQENVPRLDLSNEFAAIIFDAPEGQLVGPLEDVQGFTIVKVTKKDLGPSPSLDKVREMIEERVRRQKTSKEYERWIESRRKRAMIEMKN